jgi:CPA1 family monovalent cation:H+ antiporter
MHHDPVITTVVTIVALLLVAAAAAIGLKRVHLPFTVGLVIVGLALGAIADRVEPLAFLNSVTLSPEIILFVFLPTLIFESAFNLDSRLLSRNLAPVLALAAPGLVLSTVLIGGLVAAVTPLSLGPALLFGALISATDPVAVVALFKELGAPKRLAILVEGESLFNDATAIVLFRVILGVVAGGAISASVVGSGIANFAVVFLGGLIVGAAIGYLMIRSIALARDEPVVQVALSTVVAYAAFIAADEFLRVSGVMATTGAGIVVGALGSTRFTAQVREYLHRFWEYAAFVANSLIFLLVGLSVSLSTIAEYLGPIAITIGIVLLVRAVAVFGLIPITSRLPGAEAIGGRYQTVMFWGGLRGAVALALALSLPASFAQRDLIIALAIGVVLFTLLSGGLSMGPLIHFLGLDEPTLAERVAKAQAALAAKREALRRLGEMATAGPFSSSLLERAEEDYRRGVESVESQLAALRNECTTDEIRRVLWSEAVTVEQTAYRDLFHHGAISEPVLRELELAVELARDGLKSGATPRGVPSVAPLEVRASAGAVRLLGRIAPNNRLVQRQRLRALAARYEHNVAVFEASSRVVSEIDHLGELTHAHPEVTLECRHEFEQRSHEAMERIDSVAEHFPEYVNAVQQQTTRRIALDGEADAVEHLASSGVIPESVAREARQRVEHDQRELTRQPVSALEPRPEELLARVPLFEGLDSTDFQQIVRLLAPRTVLAGERIIGQGERGTSLFLIARGVVAVLVAQNEAPQRVATLHAGEFFGEMALLTAEPRAATVQAVSDCQLYELTKRDVDSVCEVCSGVKTALIAAYEERRATERRIGKRPSHY